MCRVVSASASPLRSFGSELQKIGFVFVIPTRQSQVSPRIHPFVNRHELEQKVNTGFKTYLTTRKSDNERYRRVAAVALNVVRRDLRRRSNVSLTG